MLPFSPFRTADSGDLYKKAVAAAIAFGKQYNSLSIKADKEYLSVIYSVMVNGDKKYSYTEPNIGGEGGGFFNRTIPEGATLEAFIHTHGGDNPKFKPEEFEGKDSYITTPSGWLLVLPEEENRDRPVCNCLPMQVGSKNSGIDRGTLPKGVNIGDVENPIRRGNLKEKPPAKKVKPPARKVVSGSSLIGLRLGDGGSIDQWRGEDKRAGL